VVLDIHFELQLHKWNVISLAGLTRGYRMNGLTRRKVFIALAAVLSVFLRRRVFGGILSDDILADDLVGVFEGHQSSAKVVGLEYLRGVPGEATETRLVSLICSGHGKPPPIGCGPRAIREWASARSRDDFGAGRVVEVQGWVLSATEVRLCALAALS